MSDEPRTDAAPTCFHHTDRETGRRCTRCGRYACPDCLKEQPVGAQCFECLRQERPDVRRQVRATLRDPMLLTKSIVAANVLMFVLQVANGSQVGFIFGGSGNITSFDARWGLFSPAVAAGQWERMVTSGFIHFGIMHILFNMLILYRLGQEMEAGIGRLRFGLIYLASLLAGSLGMVLVDDKALGGGASGAIFGLAAAATIALYQRGVRFYQTGWGPLLAINLVITFTLPGIGIGAHVGGLAAGGILGAVMLHPHHGHTNKQLGYALAVAIIVISSVGTVYESRDKFPECVGSTGRLHTLCTAAD